MKVKKEIVLIGIIIIILLVLYGCYWPKREGFTTDAAAAALGEAVTSDASVLLPPTNNGQYDPRNDSSQATANRLLQAATAVPTLKAGTIEKRNTTSLPTNLSGTRLAAIKKCEAVTGSDCSVFNDKEFSENCGICFEPGEISSGEKRIGGMYFSPEHRSLLKNEKDARPSVGSCPRGKFAVSAAGCKRISGQLECKKTQSFGSSCFMCADTTQFSYVDLDDAGIISPTLVLTGKGRAQIGISEKVVLSDAPVEIPIDSKQDGYLLPITVEGSALAGYIKGDTKRGEYRQDIFRLIETDLVSKAKPKASGKTRINGEDYIRIVPGTGQKSMMLGVNVTYTFIGTESEYADDCPTAPFITKESSAQKLSSGTCFSAGNKEGAYSLECLQEIWAEAGCTAKGSEYPADSGSAGSLNSKGKLADISNYIYELAIRATSGTTSGGQALSIKEWGDAAKKCTGEIIESSCDLPPPAGRKISKDCMTYLYKNEGKASKRIGPTYSGGGEVFCTDAGLLNPDAVAVANDKIIMSELPAVAKIIGVFEIKKNWRIRFIVNPKGIVGGQFSSLFHFTRTGKDCCDVGDRMPAIWFWPNTTRLHIRIGDASSGNWGVDPEMNLPLNQDTAVEIVANGNSIRVKINSIEYGYTQPNPGSRPRGNATLWAPDGTWKGYPRMNGSLKNLSLFTSDTLIPSNFGNYIVDPVKMGINEVKAVYNKAFSDMTNAAVAPDDRIAALAACRGIGVAEYETNSARRGVWTNRVEGTQYNL